MLASVIVRVTGVNEAGDVVPDSQVTAIDVTYV
jgi:hypothetical protein